MGSLALRPLLVQRPSPSFQVSPRSSSIWSPVLLRRRDDAFASVFTGADCDRPLLVSLPRELLTWMTRESPSGRTTVHPAASRVTDIIRRHSSESNIGTLRRETA